jgi:uncharacterized protein (TIGR00730 family)
MKSICVYCGAKPGRSDTFKDTAIALADYLVDHDMTLVNGGGSVGLMGIMADRVIERKGKCIGVIPISLRDKEVAHFGMSDLITVPDMHARKLTMVNLSDAFIALPGGFGTLDELFETLTWAQLHLHRKPIGILNVNNYFDHLVRMLDHMEVEGFLKADAKSLLRVADTIEGLFHLFEVPGEPLSRKWS